LVKEKPYQHPSPEVDVWVKLHVGNRRTPISIVHPGRRVTLGRWQATNPGEPDIDLSPYGAYEYGVSRVHAVIRTRHGHATVVDLDSTNGSQHNGKPLKPGQPTVLQDGDELIFGKLRVRVRVTTQPRSAVSANAAAKVEGKPAQRLTQPGKYRLPNFVGKIRPYAEADSDVEETVRKG
jgi:hypothetical protein